jgi:hypothetical protein
LGSWGTPPNPRQGRSPCTSSSDWGNLGFRVWQLMVGVRGFEPPASWSQTMRASRCATPRNWRIYHSGEAKSKVSSLSTTLTRGTTAGPESAMLNHLTLTRVVQSGGPGDTPDPGSILLHRLPSFPRRRESSSRDSVQPPAPEPPKSPFDKGGFQGVRNRGTASHSRQDASSCDSVSTPLVPNRGPRVGA